MGGNDRVAVGHLSLRRSSATHYILVAANLRPATGKLLTLCGRTSKYGDDGWWDAGDPTLNWPSCSECARLVVITKETW